MSAKILANSVVVDAEKDLDLKIENTVNQKIVVYHVVDEKGSTVKTFSFIDLKDKPTKNELMEYLAKVIEHVVGYKVASIEAVYELVEDKSYHA